MPYIKLITGEILQVADKTADRVRNNLTAMHTDKSTGIRFAGSQVVLIYPDSYNLIPTILVDDLNWASGKLANATEVIPSLGVGDEESGGKGVEVSRKPVGRPPKK